jgi:hypothetical protein
MIKAKIAITIDEPILARIDRLVAEQSSPAVAKPLKRQ